MARPVFDLTTRTTPLDELRPHPSNPRNGDTDAIAASLQVNGQYRPIVVARGVILAGNHTYAAAHELGWTSIEAVHLDLDPDSPEAHRIMVADNRTADLGRYDEGLLLDLLHGLDELDGTGYTVDDLADLQRIVDAPLDLDDDGGRAPSPGELLAIADVSVGEPTHQVHHGQTWRLGHHLLVVAKVTDEPEVWSPHLEGRKFCPYPDPYITTTDYCQAHPCLFVQPDLYLAGHLIDKHESVYPGTVVAP